jgi:hypothetical protein
VGILLLKLFIAPLLVVASTLAGRKWGPGMAGILVGQPVVAGPILFIAYLQHGAVFASDATASSLLGVVSIAVFAVVFSRTARRFGWSVTLAAGWTAVLVADAALSVLRVTVLAVFAITLAAIFAAMVFMPGADPELPGGRGLPSSPSWDLPGRAAATCVLVLAVTTASGALGPHWTGLLAPFPIAISVVAAFVHAQYGHLETARTLRGVLMGLMSLSAFCLSVSLLVRHIGSAAFLVGLAVAVAAQLLAVCARRTVAKGQATTPAVSAPR